MLVVEQEFGERPGQFRLADARRPEKEEVGDRPVRVLQAGTGAAHGVGDGGYRPVLADDASPERRFHFEQLLSRSPSSILSTGMPVQRETTAAMASAPTSSLSIRLSAASRSLSLPSISGMRPYLISDARARSPDRWACSSSIRAWSSASLSFWESAIFSFSACQIAVRVGALLLQLAELAGQLVEPFPGAVVALLLQRLLFDLELHDPPVELVDLVGLGIDLHAQAGRGLVHQVDRLVGQEALHDVAAGERGSRDERRIGDAHAVMEFVFLLQAAQDGDGVLHRRLADEDRLEAPGERGVLLDMLAVFVQRRGADTVQRAAGQRRLEHVGGVHRAFRRAGADQRVQLVDEQHDVAGGSLDFLEQRLQPLLEFAAEFGSGDHGAEVERHDPLVAQALRHVAFDDAPRQALGDRRLADTGLADQYRIVLGPARQDLHRPADLVVAADDRVELALARVPGEVAGKFLQGVVGVLGRRAVGGPALADVVDRRVQALRRGPSVLQDFCGLRTHSHRQRQQQPLDGDETVAGLFGQLSGAVQNPRGLRPEIDLALPALDPGQLAEGEIGRFQGACRIAAGGADQVCRQALRVVEQGLEQVLGNELLMVFPKRDCLGGLNEATRALRKVLEVHSLSSRIASPPFAFQGRRRDSQQNRQGGTRFGSIP